MDGWKDNAKPLEGDIYSHLKTHKRPSFETNMFYYSISPFESLSVRNLACQGQLHTVRQGKHIL